MPLAARIVSAISWGDGLLAPDDLAAMRAAGAPTGRELGDDVQAAAVLGVLVDLEYPGSAGEVSYTSHVSESGYRSG
jgi:hypothetical protein